MPITESPPLQTWLLLHQTYGLIYKQLPSFGPRRAPFHFSAEAARLDQDRHMVEMAAKRPTPRRDVARSACFRAFSGAVGLPGRQRSRRRVQRVCFGRPFSLSSE
jgi:hypothetical protein